MKKQTFSQGGAHKTVLEMFSGNGVAFRLCRSSVLAGHSVKARGRIPPLSGRLRQWVSIHLK